MQIVSLNVGLPRTYQDRGREIVTGIFKAPVSGPVVLQRLNLDGDRQADLEVHGGPYKAVYAYASEHYPFWQKEYPEMELPPGMFGENFTTEGLFESDACIGDHYRIGEAVVMVRQPRLPCYKLAFRFDHDDILKRFVESGRSGIYFSVLENGPVNTGDTIVRVHQDEDRLSIADVNLAYRRSAGNLPLLRRASQHQMLAPGMREHFSARLASLEP